MHSPVHHIIAMVTNYSMSKDILPIQTGKAEWRNGEQQHDPLPMIIIVLVILNLDAI